MNRTLQLQQEKTALVDKAGAILKAVEAEKRSAMTTEEQATFKSLSEQAEGIAATIDAEQRHASIAGHKPAQVRENILDKEFTSFGEQLQVIRSAALAPHNVDVRLLELNKRAATGASEAVPADGGYLVYPDFSDKILQITHDVGLVSKLADTMPINSNSIKLPGIDEQSRANGSRFGGIQMYWQDEAGALTGSKPKFRLIEMTLKKLTGLFYSTDELLEDAGALGAIVTKAFSEEMAFKLDDAVIRGTGAGMPLGILNCAPLITVSKETGQASQTVVYENIKKMWGRMWARSRKSAVWFINQDTEQQLYGMSQIVGTAGSPVFLPPGGASDEPYSRLYGRPVIPIEQCDTLGNAGDIILADFSQYQLVNKVGGMQSAVSMHVRFVNDEQTFRWVYRTDGQPIWHTALTPFKGSNTLSPFITLAAR